MKIVFSCGGTGGHINPALAVADYIKSKYPDAEISFISAEHGLGAQLIKKAGYKCDTVSILGFKRKLTLSNIKVAYKAVTSVFAAKKLLKMIQPDVVVGTGGYASYAAVKAAAKMKIPTVIHEQNAFPGVTTKKLYKCADKACISFKESEKYFPDTNKIIVTGNPVKPSILASDKDEARKQLGIGKDETYVVSFGGSLGADKINEFVFEMLEKYIAGSKIRYTHATGKTRFESFNLSELKKKIDGYNNIEVVEYIYDMPKVMAAADIIISRAGAITLAEAACLGKAIILIPSPNVAENHQHKNALVLKNAGAALLLPESESNGWVLAENVKRLVENKEELELLGSNIKQFAAPEATKKIADIVLGYCK